MDGDEELSRRALVLDSVRGRVGTAMAETRPSGRRDVLLVNSVWWRRRSCVS